MKKINIYVMMFCILFCFAACSGNDDIGAIEVIGPDYTLPQGQSDADDRIVEYYEQYNTYILYDFTSTDFYYDMSTMFTYELPDPQYVGDMLDLLEDIWFDFYPAEFHQKYMPYKLFLTKYVQQAWGTGYLQLFTVVGTTPSHCYTMGFCSDTLQKITPDTKLYFKNEIQRYLWGNWYSVIELPDEFFSVSDYSTSVSAYDPSAENYSRKRGFVADYYYGYDNEWSGSYVGNSNYDISIVQGYDARAFLTRMATHSEEEWASDLEYPLVKKKYDIIRNWLQEKYGFDLQKVGDATYE